ncbi:hypothetical protein P355_1323 [Burkholderia cenocepacia KC-01]|nr:hypothetical protein P355_1323 [Burkholderia cenocepacia KC-01]
MTREASRAGRHEFVGKRGTATRDGHPGRPSRGDDLRGQPSVQGSGRYAAPAIEAL